MRKISAAVLGVVFLVGCGGSGGTRTAYTPPPDPTPDATRLAAIHQACQSRVEQDATNSVGSKYEHEVSGFSFSDPVYGDLPGHPPTPVYDTVVSYTTTPSGTSSYARTPRPYQEKCRYYIAAQTVELSGGHEG